MMVSGLILLPILALVLVFNCTWLGGGESILLRSRKHQRRHRAKVLFHRSAIVSLVVATIVAYRMPSDAMSDLALGTIFTAAFMVPVCVYLLIVELKAPHSTSDDITEFAPGATGSSKLMEGSKPGVAEAQWLPDVELSTSAHQQEMDSTVEKLSAEVAKLKKLVNLQRAAIENEKHSHKKTHARLADARVVIKNAIRRDALLQDLIQRERALS